MAASPEHLFELARDIEWLPAWNGNLEMRHVQALERIAGQQLESLAAIAAPGAPPTG